MRLHLALFHHGEMAVNIIQQGFVLQMCHEWALYKEHIERLKIHWMGLLTHLQIPCLRGSSSSFRGSASAWDQCCPPEEPGFGRSHCRPGEARYKKVGSAVRGRVNRATQSPPGSVTAAPAQEIHPPNASPLVCSRPIRSRPERSRSVFAAGTCASIRDAW